MDKESVEGRASFIPREKDAFNGSPVEWNKPVGQIIRQKRGFIL